MKTDDNVRGLLLLLSISHIAGALWGTLFSYWQSVVIFLFRIFASMLTTASLNKVWKTFMVTFKMTWKKHLHEWIKSTQWANEEWKCSLLRFHFRKRTSCGQGRARYPDTANTFSTTGYLITSIATCSLMTPITRLPDRSGTGLRQIKCISRQFQQRSCKSEHNHCWREFVNLLPWC